MAKPHNELFSQNISGDTALYSNSSSFSKLSLDTKKHCLGNDPSRMWFNSLEDNVIKHIQKVDKENRFYDFRKLPFCWAPCEVNAEIRDDPTMGIPSSEAQYNTLRKEGRYVDTEIEHIYFNITRSKEDVVTIMIMDESDPGASKIELKRRFSKFFLGVPYDLAPHKSDADKTFPKMWLLVDEVRRSLRIASVKLETNIPHMIVPMFRGSRYRNWSDVKVMTLDFLKLKKDNVDLQKFPSFLRVISDPRMRGYRIESKIITLREFFIPFFRTLDVDGKKCHLGEINHDRCPAVNDRPVYNPFLNWLCICLVLMGEEAATVKKWFQDLATKLNKEEEDILMWDVLNNKTFLYDKINKKNGAELTFDQNIFEYAHKNTPGDMVKGVFQLNNYRKEGVKERMTKDSGDKEKAFLISQEEEVEQEEDLYFSQEMNAYFKRVERPRGTRARAFNPRGGKNKYGGGNGQQNRPQNKINYKTSGKVVKKQGRPRFDKKDFMNRGRKYLNDNRRKNTRFRTRFSEAKNPGISPTGTDQKPMVSKRRFERLRALTEDALEVIDEGVEFVNQMMDTVEKEKEEWSSEEEVYRAEVSSPDEELETEEMEKSAISGIYFILWWSLWVTSLSLGAICKVIYKLLIWFTKINFQLFCEIL